MRIQNINKFYVVSGLVILAALLRLPTLGSPLMEDEGIMFSRYSGLPWDTLLLKYDTTNQHTLYLLLSDFCISLFGKNEIAFRLPSLGRIYTFCDIDKNDGKSSHIRSGFKGVAVDAPGLRSRL